MKSLSIQNKILILILTAVFLITFIILYVAINNQENNLLNSTKQTLALNTQLLNSTIRNIMLDGEADIAVNTLTSFKNIPDFDEIEIYRVSGENAFNDFSTLDSVNSMQNDIEFPKRSNRRKKTTIQEKYKDTKSTINNFNYVVEYKSSVEDELRQLEEMEYFFPILNFPECRKCHGETNVTRGVIHLRISIESIYNNIQASTILLLVLIGVSSVILIFILIYFTRRIIIQPVINISDTVKLVSGGDFDARVNIRDKKVKDEIDNLSSEINTMIKNIEERFRLAKYVSRSTDNLIKQGKDVVDGQKQNITVLFSDIRGFTSYAEKNPPEKVIENLNLILDVQSQVIENYGGDIDKFVGDEIMAIFENEHNAVLAAYKMIQAVANVSNKKNINLQVGIGINSGEVIAGNIGSKNRLEYAVIGDTVNVAARLCSIAKPNMILISEETNAKLKEIIESELIKNQTIKGKSKKINFYVVKSLKDG